jgi:uncharacterized cofD-like protein
VEAVLAADWIVLGPGSLFSSVVPHLLVPELREALRATRARLVHVLNLAPQPGETDGFSPATHLEVLGAQAPGLPWEVVIADPVAVEDVAELRVAVGEHRHHPVRLAEVFDELFTSGSPPSATDPDDVFDAGALDQHDLSVLHDAEATWRP